MLESGNDSVSLRRYRSVLKCHAKSYRKKIEINSILVIEKYKKLVQEHKELGTKYKVLLGDFRHDNLMCNYNYLVEVIELKWGPQDKVLERDIIHSVSNKCNDLLLEILLEYNNK